MPTPETLLPLKKKRFEVELPCLVRTSNHVILMSKTFRERQQLRKYDCEHYSIPVYLSIQQSQSTSVDDIFTETQKWRRQLRQSCEKPQWSASRSLGSWLLPFSTSVSQNPIRCRTAKAASLKGRVEKREILKKTCGCKCTYRYWVAVGSKPVSLTYYSTSSLPQKRT